jgi:hypothetical protein
VNAGGGGGGTSMNGIGPLGGVFFRNSNRSHTSTSLSRRFDIHAPHNPQKKNAFDFFSAASFFTFSKSGVQDCFVFFFLCVCV